MTMQRYAVVYVNLIENDILIEFVIAASEREAIFKHSYIGDEWRDVPQSIEDIKQFFFDIDILVGARPIPSTDKSSA